MNFFKKSGVKSKFPQYDSRNFPILKKSNNKGNEEQQAEYLCFGINDIYREVFTEIFTCHIIKREKELLAFLLPPSIFEQIENATLGEGDNKKPYVISNDYREFFLPSTNNNKITKLLFNIFSSNERNSEKLFIESIQDHFVKILRYAEYQSDVLKHLENLVDNGIAPKTVSLKANQAFHALIESQNHDNISKAIANIFISAMLGLYSMKYSTPPKKEGGRDYVFARTYLLNKLGMEFIWTPETISNAYLKLQDAVYLYECGEYNEAYIKTLLWLAKYRNTTIRSHELASAYYVLGACLYQHPEYCNLDDISSDEDKTLKKLRSVGLFGETNSVLSSDANKEKKCYDGILFLKECITQDETISEAFFLLFDYYKHSEDDKQAFEYLKKAFSLSFIKAVIEVANRYIKGEESWIDISEDLIVDKLTSIITYEQDYSEVEVSECLYLRGRIYLKANKEFAAKNDFERAAKNGHEKARQLLGREVRRNRQQIPSFSDDPTAPCCFVNNLNGNNLVFISTLPDKEWSIFTPGESNTRGIDARIDEFFHTQHLGSDEFKRPKLVFAFMSEDENQNINDTLTLLDKLFNIALEAEGERYNLIRCIDIYLRAKYEIASMLIDANIDDMGKDIYFKVHIKDETRDSVHQLLSDAPLFIPFLNRPKHDETANIVLFGCSETNYRFIKESIACAYLGEKHAISITMLGTDADRMEKRLRQECPGLFHKPYLKRILPTFISCCIEEEDFPSLIYGSKHDRPDNKLAEVLSVGNYFVVDLSSDYDSIRFAMEMRTWLLRSRGTFDRTPFIAVKCTNSQNSYLAEHLTLSGQGAGNTYYSRYNLFPFGVAKELYSFHHLIEHPRIEEVGLQIHKSYYGENELVAENDYYSYSYNSDSSQLTAIGLSYRLFAGGVFFPRKEQYLDYGIYDSPDLLSQYDTAIKGKEDSAAALEQSRWNGFMLSRGWEPAGVEQVRAYKDQSTGSSHKHMLAKLHPFIKEWSELDDKSLKPIFGMLQSKFDYKKLPKDTTLKSIQDTPKFLGKFISDDEKTR